MHYHTDNRLQIGMLFFLMNWLQTHSKSLSSSHEGRHEAISAFKLGICKSRYMVTAHASQEGKGICRDREGNSVERD